MKKAICLLSGGLDSTTALYVARREGYEVVALTLEYGQWHHREIDAAKSICRELGISHEVISISLPWGGSALLDRNIPIPTDRDPQDMEREIPSTYVPARNTIFLSFAISYAEACSAEAVFIGANALDYSGYPDCRSEYFDAFNNVVRLGTKAGVEGRAVKIVVPLLHLKKKDIVSLGHSLGIPLGKTWSCYQGGEVPCEQCDACRLRAKGFREAGLKDPLVNRASSAIRQ